MHTTAARSCISSAELPLALVASIILIGITGVVTSLYSEVLRGILRSILGFWIAGMSVATIAAVLIYSRVDLPPCTSHPLVCGADR
ncbi:MAG: hypothetical protein MZV63_46025 [Marinilabiliales bacterium]|nr:hypothetical protein [Marinilabiliales bacterium]